MNCFSDQKILMKKTDGCRLRHCGTRSQNAWKFAICSFASTFIGIGMIDSLVHVGYSAESLSSPIYLSQSVTICYRAIDQPSQINVYEQPSLAANIRPGPLFRGDLVTGTPPDQNGWIHLQTPRNGYVLAALFEPSSDCSSTNTPSEPDTSNPISPNYVVVEACGVVRQEVGGDLALRRSPGGESIGNLMPGAEVALGTLQKVGDRYWTRVLAYSSQISPIAGEVWIAETGPNAPDDLSRGPDGFLYRPNETVFGEVNIEPRSCDSFSVLREIRVGSPIPNQLTSEPAG